MSYVHYLTKIWRCHQTPKLKKYINFFKQILCLLLVHFLRVCILSPNFEKIIMVAVSLILLCIYQMFTIDIRILLVHTKILRYHLIWHSRISHNIVDWTRHSSYREGKIFPNGVDYSWNKSMKIYVVHFILFSCFSSIFFCPWHFTGN